MINATCIIVPGSFLLNATIKRLNIKNAAIIKITPIAMYFKIFPIDEPISVEKNQSIPLPNNKVATIGNTKNNKKSAINDKQPFILSSSFMTYNYFINPTNICTQIDCTALLCTSQLYTCFQMII